MTGPVIDHIQLSTTWLLRPGLLWNSTPETFRALDSTATLALATRFPFESTFQLIVIKPSWLVSMCVPSAPPVASRTLDETLTVADRTGLIVSLVTICHGSILPSAMIFFSDKIFSLRLCRPSWLRGEAVVFGSSSHHIRSNRTLRFSAQPRNHEQRLLTHAAPCGC